MRRQQRPTPHRIQKPRHNIIKKRRLPRARVVPYRWQDLPHAQVAQRVRRRRLVQPLPRRGRQAPDLGLDLGACGFGVVYAVEDVLPVGLQDGGAGGGGLVPGPVGVEELVFYALVVVSCVF